MSEYIRPLNSNYFGSPLAEELKAKKRQRNQQNRIKTEGLLAAPPTFIRVSLAGTICKKRADDMEKLLKSNGIPTTTFLYRDKAIEHMLTDDIFVLKVKANLSIKATKAAIVRELVDRKIVFTGCPDYSNLDVSTEGISL